MKLVTLFFTLCLTAALVPLHSAAPRIESSDTFPGWATAPLPTSTANIPLGSREARFAKDFPGQIGAFSDGTRTYVVRWVRTPTRKLHPAADCLRALGYDVHPTPILAEDDGSRWGTSSAQRTTEQLRVLERIIDSNGRAWTDVSAWFWAAALGHSTGPWWAVTVFEPAGIKARL